MVRQPVHTILDTVGDTPLVQLHRLGDRHGVEVYAKLERFNPGGSIKDRTAATMLREGLLSGELDPARTVVIESSSGNLGIGLAQVCCYHGIPFICVVDPKTPAQTLAALRAYGTDVRMVTERDADSGEYLPVRLRRVRQLLQEIPGAYWPNQYANPLNPLAHRRTMQEIAEALDGRVDHLFVATSTTGTVNGCSQYVREIGMTTRVVAVDAVGSVLFSHLPPGYRVIPGLGASVRPPLLDPESVDQVVHVRDLE